MLNVLHSLKIMDNKITLTERIFFRECKFLYRVLGLWFEDRLLDQRNLLNSFIFLSIVIAIALAQVVFMVVNIKSDAKSTLEVACTSSSCILSFIKLIVLYCSREDLIKLLERVRVAWFSGNVFLLEIFIICKNKNYTIDRTDTSVGVNLKMANQIRRVFMTYLGCAYATSMSFFMKPVVINIYRLICGLGYYRVLPYKMSLVLLCFYHKLFC